MATPRPVDYFNSPQQGVWLDADGKVSIYAADSTKAATVDSTSFDFDVPVGTGLVTGEAQGDVLVRGASGWEVESVGADEILAGDGTDVVACSVAGDASVSVSGTTATVSVSDLTIASEAQGDLVRRGASAWERVAAATTGQFVVGDGTDVVSAPMTGDVSVAVSGGNAVATLAADAQLIMRVPAASGIDTDANNGGLAGCDQTLDVTNTEAATALCKVYDDSATTYYNLKAASADDHVQYQLLPSNTQDADAVFFGGAVPFCEIHMDMSATVQTYTNDATVWTYWNGASWASLTLAHDYTDATAQDGNRSFGRDGAISFVPPSDWASTTVDSQAGYWIKCAAGTAANISQVGQTDSVNHYVVTPTVGLTIPHDGTVTAVTIRDEAATVHTTTDVKLIVHNFTTGEHSGELTFAQDKRSTRWGSLTLAVNDGDSVGVLVTQEDGTNEAGPFTLEIEITNS